MIRIFICFLLLIVFTFPAMAQRVGVYAYSRGLGAAMLKSDVNTMIDYYNEQNKTTLAKPRFGGGYKAGIGFIMGRAAMGMSQHEHYLSTQGKKGELTNGYRTFDVKHRSRNGVAGFSINKEDSEHQFNLEGGIGRSVINTGFVYNDGFKSYGPESGLNGSYWVRSFHIGAEYIYLKEWNERLSLSGGVGLHTSSPLAFGRFEDQMDYKRGGTNYVLYKDDPAPGGFEWNDPAHVMAKYTFMSVMFGIQYNFNKEI